MRARGEFECSYARDLRARSVLFGSLCQFGEGSPRRALECSYGVRLVFLPSSLRVRVFTQAPSDVVILVQRRAIARILNCICMLWCLGPTPWWQVLLMGVNL